MMMQGIRKAGQGLIGKIIVFVLFGFLIFSFAIWGIGDIFRGYGRNAVATVGKTEIGVEQLRTAYQNEIQQLTRQQRRPISPELARALGLDRQVLARLMSDAALDQTAERMRLAASDDTIRNLIFEDPNFKNASGAFDASRFNDLLRSNGLNEQVYVRDQRATILRQQLAEMASGAVTAPVALQELGHRLRHEKRDVAYAVMPATAVGPIAAPSDEVLKRFFDDRKSAFRAPEFRTGHVLALTAEDIAASGAISEADARARYEQVKAARFTTPERRTLQQIGFGTIEEAQAARKRIADGTGFEAIAQERNISDQDLTTGTFERDQLFDPKIRDAAFGLAENAVSEPVQGNFGPVLLRVTKIDAAHVRPFEEVAADARRDLAAGRLTELHDRVEDQRASARPLPEIAKEFGLTLRAIGPIDASLRRPDGSQADALPGGDATRNALFQSDIGVDNEALRLPNNGGYVWYDVTKIDPPRDRTFDEVKAEVERQWRADETANLLSAKARELIKRLDSGEAFDAVATSAGLTAAEAAGLSRQDQTDTLPRNVVSLIFGTPAGKNNSAALDDGGRVLFHVKSATQPPYVRTTQEADSLVQALSGALSQDILQEYVSRLQADLGATLNEAAFRNATGGNQN